MTQHATTPGNGGASLAGRQSVKRIRATDILSQPARAVNNQIREQSAAAEQRALANAEWHRERAARYLAWTDTPWAAEQYRAHTAAAEFQGRLAARHAAVLAAMGEVRP